MSKAMRLGIGVAVGFGILLVLSGCQTSDTYITGGTGLQFSTPEMEMSVNYLTEPELDRRFSGKYNPFIPPGLMITPQDFIIFEFDVTRSETPHEVLLSRASLEYGGRVDEPDNKFQFRSFWNGVSWVEDMRGVEKRKFFSLIDSYVVGDDFSTSQKTLGFIVFRGSFPDYGEATLNIPVANTTTGERYNLSESWEFSAAYYE